jgi:hypothetical protein
MGKQALVVALSGALFLVGCGGEEANAVSSCATGETLGGIVTKLGFTRTKDADHAPGFDLDGRVSDDNDSASCGKKDFIDEEGRTGIDNQLAPLVPEVEKLVGDAVDGLIQGAINDGSLVILMEMENVDDPLNDDCVNFTVQNGEIRRPNLGTDGTVEAYQTFTPDAMAARSHASNAKIENGVFTAGPFPVSLPLAFFDVAFTLHVQNARFRFTIDEDGLMHGYMGGGVLPQEILDGVGQGNGTGDFLPQIKVAIDANTDLAFNDETGKCDQLSATLEFSGVPAFVRR